MATASAFSSEDDVTKKHVECDAKEATDQNRLPQVYELERCCHWIRDHGYTRVALQFPDRLLVDSVPVQDYIQRRVTTGATVFILGDTSYGSCCVDEVTAEHYQADSVVHFGPTCLSPTQRLPALHVLGHQPLDAAHAVQQLMALCPSGSKVIVLADTMYQHAVEALAEHLKETHSVVASSLKMPSNHPSSEKTLPSHAVSGEENKESVQNCGEESTKNSHEEINKNEDNVHNCEKDGDENREEEKDKSNEENSDKNIDKAFCTYCKCNRHFSLPKGHNLEDYSVFFLGQEGKLLTNLMMTMSRNKFFSFEPETGRARQETLNVNRELMKRFYMIERAKDARIVGIVAGTLGVSRTREIIAHLKMIMKNAGKKSYTFVVGKLNPAKLGNFLEVDVFVLVACQLNTLIDSKEFLKPVVSPYEMEVACNQARQWTGDYVTDFSQLLPGAREYIPAVAAEQDSADVSLVSNKLRSMGQRSEVKGIEGSSSVMLRSDALAVANLSAETAGEFLASRSWQGLDRKLGQTPVEKAKEGRSGIAMGYQTEPH